MGRRHILVIVDEAISDRVSVSADRVIRLAIGLAEEHVVTLCSTVAIATKVSRVRSKELSGGRLSLYAQFAHLTIATPTAAGRLRRLRRGPLCIDLGYFSLSDFSTGDIRGAEFDPQSGLTERLHLVNAALQSGDFFLCASECDRSSWLGALAAAGRIRAHLYDADPKLRRLLDVAPLASGQWIDGPSEELPAVVRRYCASPWRNRPNR